MSGPAADGAAPPPVGPPRRPSFASGLPQRAEIPTPRTIGVVRWAVRLSVLAFIVPTAFAALRQADLRKTLRKALTEQAPDYSATDIGHAVVVALVSVAAIGVLLSLLELSALSVLRQRRRGGRTALIVLTLIHLPALVVISAFRGGESADLALTALQAFLLVIAAGAAIMPATRHWLDAKPPLAVKSLLVPQQASDHPERSEPGR
ncbi:hypothetical protein C6I20_16305 [Aeromicrobium sp. A1-2]|uniref:hypothetical protein n=1 Tax=Aeromicrobium sp. A1-2 TaxID=2107713 RepID=UPI000E554B0D|nr:hypothetical protein [Aeromicrobium sp. A1-2]AXT86575.1 hypothetical protein C6I20_16305 [Aeromicrobium sp. A1-2]